MRWAADTGAGEGGGVKGAEGAAADDGGAGVGEFGLAAGAEGGEALLAGVAVGGGHQVSSRSAGGWTPWWLNAATG